MNKRIWFLLATTCISLSVLIFAGLAKTAFAATQAKVNVNSLNVREKATADSKKLGLLKKGQVVTISQEKAGWTRIPYGKSTGWVSSRYLSKTTAVKESTKEGYVTVASLNLRKSASTSSAKLATLKKGELVQITSSNGSWIKVNVPSIKKSGWVSKSYILFGKSITPTPRTVSKETAYYVTANSLNIRKEPNTKSDIVVAATKNEKLIVTEVRGNWGKVTTVSGLSGWASLSYLTEKAPTIKPPTTNGLENKVIVIDPGHGGKDPGASGQQYQEKTLTLNIAKELERSLKATGMNVIMTRDGDTYPTLTERVNISHTNKADIFISIHLNSNSNKEAQGTDTYYYETNVNERELANCIQEEVIKATGLKNRGIHEGNFQVIRTNAKAAILVELGFISNPEEEKILASKEFQVQAAAGIVKGIERYFN